MFPMKKIHSVSRERLPFWYLAAAGLLEFLFITMVCIPSYLGYYLAETYLIVPCLLFLGHVLQTKQSDFARRRLVLAVAAVVWFVISQIIHKLYGMENQPISTVLGVYLLAFPFAALTDDRENTGLWQTGKFFLAAALVLVAYSGILLLDLVPDGWKEFLYWDGTRLNVFWHPNITACYLMIGMGFGMVFLLRAKKTLTKVLLAAAVAVQFLTMALTNCRTTLLMTGALLGGIAFFLISRGGWKRLVLGLLAAALILVGSFKLSGEIYRWNEDRIISAVSAIHAGDDSEADTDQNAVAEEEQEEQHADAYAAAAEQEEQHADAYIAAEEEQLEERTADAYTAEEEKQVELAGENPQGSLVSDMASLNGRTYIWKSALQAIRDNKALALWGTEYSGTVISVYNSFPVEHSHNSWMEVLLRAGIPGLLIALIFTLLSAVRAAELLLSSRTELWKKIIAMLTMCVMVSGFLEPYLFGGKAYYHVIDFIFLFCTGYLDFWCKEQKM